MYFILNENNFGYTYMIEEYLYFRALACKLPRPNPNKPTVEGDTPLTDPSDVLRPAGPDDFKKFRIFHPVWNP